MADERTEALRRHLAAEEAAEKAEAAAGRKARKSTYTKKSAEGGGFRINGVTAAFMLMTAIFFDIIQGGINLLTLIPIVGFGFMPVVYGVSILSFIIFFVWFKTKGVDYWKGRKAAVKLVSLFAMLLLGFVPVLSIIPEITAGVAVMILAARIEDTVGDQGQLSRIANRRVKRRDALERLNRQRLKKTERKNEGRQGGEKKVERERGRGEKRLNRYDRQTKIENMRMAARVAMASRKRPVDGVTPKQEADQRSRQGYYRPYEYADEATDDSWQDATNEYVDETEEEYRRRVRDRAENIWPW